MAPKGGSSCESQQADLATILFSQDELLILPPRKPKLKQTSIAQIDLLTCREVLALVCRLLSGSFRLLAMSLISSLYSSLFSLFPLLLGHFSPGLVCENPLLDEKQIS